MDDADFVRNVGAAFRVARGDQPVLRAGDSGVGYRVIDRIERAVRTERGVRTGDPARSLEFSHCYLLALYYDVDLRRVLRARESPTREQLGHWRALPSLPDTDAHLRRELRARRLAAGLGTPSLAGAAGVHQSWLAMFESGRISRCDLVRVHRLAEALDLALADLLPVPPRPRASAQPEAT